MVGLALRNGWASLLIAFLAGGLGLSTSAIYNLPQLHAEHFPPVLTWPALNYVMIQQPTVPFEESRRFLQLPMMFRTWTRLAQLARKHATPTSSAAP